MAVPELHFLVVDDMKPMRRIIIALLELLGHTSASEAENGRHALEILRTSNAGASPISFVITDWNMPVMDGLGLVAEMRTSEALRDVPVLMISSEIGPKSLLPGEMPGVDGYLSKFSLSVELLGETVENILLAKRSRFADARLRGH